MSEKKFVIDVDGFNFTPCDVSVHDMIKSALWVATHEGACSDVEYSRMMIEFKRLVESDRNKK